GFIADVRVNPAIGDDLDSAIGEQQIDQDAAIFLGIPHRERAEYLERACARRHPLQHACRRQRRFDRDTHLPALAQLSLGDRGFDPRHRSGRKRAPGAAVIGREMTKEARKHRVAPRQSQPPEAPPPPKVPPPPDHPPPPPKPPPPPPKPPGRKTPPRRPAIVDAAPAKIITRKPTTAAIPATRSDPAK